MSDVYLKSIVVMDTVVTIQVVGHGLDEQERIERAARVEAALAWFNRIEASCSRFDAQSEVSQLPAHVGSAVAVSSALFQAVQFAMAVAEESDGAFDPTIGLRMEVRGFDREHRTGRRVHTAMVSPNDVSFRDVYLDADRETITLLRPLVLDLGAVAKGLAVDMAVRELSGFNDFVVDAGGDLYFSGCNPRGEAWSVGVRHPRNAHQMFETFTVSGAAVCTSGDYHRVGSREHPGHHILNPRTGMPTSALASVTVVAPTALVADALATAAFVLGPIDGVRLLERHGVDGLLLTPGLERHTANGTRACFPA